ncbi:hypothetical protein DFP72DRAFT_849476 [Ephemerocybe angulata]|uniref:Uncharacterized protein n=1 Tax=Ephemerocybe angulata TaxID=980116 RepID=A0A8H6M4T0_9AGAR|nr:hypothetical protein DFP72DRAFT_849476 [Tulosesus angulatus]
MASSSTSATNHVEPSLSQKDESIYAQIAAEIAARPKGWLGSGELTLGVDYAPLYTNPRSAGGWASTSFVWSNAKMDTFITAIHGTLAGKSWGTLLGAQGNFVPSSEPDRAFINDKRTVRNVLIILCNPEYPDVLKQSWSNQEIEYESVEEGVRDSTGKQTNGIIVSSPDGRQKCLRIVMPPTYKALPTNAPAPRTKTSTAPRTKVKITTMSAENDEEAHGEGAEQEATGLKECANNDTGKPGATYPVECQIGYGGPMFQHTNSVLTQPEVYGVDNELKGPWELPYVLKPGVELVIDVKTQVWHIPNKPNPVLQAYAEAIRVVKDSDAKPEIPSTYTGPPTERRDSPNSGEKRSSAFTEFGKAPMIGTEHSKKARSSLDVDADMKADEPSLTSPRSSKTDKKDKKGKGKAT